MAGDATREAAAAAPAVKVRRVTAFLPGVEFSNGLRVIVALPLVRMPCGVPRFVRIVLILAPDMQWAPGRYARGWRRRYAGKDIVAQDNNSRQHQSLGHGAVRRRVGV